MTAPNREMMLELAPAYALGALDGDDLRQFEAFLATDAEAQREVAMYRALSGEIGAATTGPAAPVGLRDRVIATTPKGSAPSVTPVTPLRAPVASGGVSPAWWAAIAASIVVMLGLGYSLRTTRDQLAAVTERLDGRESELNQLLSPTVSLVHLKATDSTSSAGIQLFVDSGTDVATVHAFKLPKAPAGKKYQLWFIEEGKAPTPSVTFDTEPDGHGLVASIPVPKGVKLALAAVTLEPESGSQTPTMPIVLAGGFPKS